MCQLTLFNFFDDFDLNDEEVKKDLLNLLYTTSVINAQDHRDGHGLNVFSKRSKKNITIRSEKTGMLGTVIKQLEGKKVSLTSPIIFHVRKASVRYIKDENLVENAHPFEGENFFTIMYQVFYRDPVLPRTLNPEIPVDLEAICLKSMEKIVFEVESDKFWEHLERYFSLLGPDINVANIIPDQAFSVETMRRAF